MKVLFTEEEIARKVAETGAEITRYYQGKSLTIMLIVNGAFIFGADLVRKVDMDCWVDSFAAASYSNDRSTGVVNFRSPPKLLVEGRHILLVDEVLDSGRTMKKVAEYFRDAGAASVRCAVLVEKDIPRPEGLDHADWACFSCPDQYLVGCGLDSNELYRNLPYIGIIE
ncbi:MAG: hypoxanthine phosphoribosyltransferase [Lentisphaeria bacterium]|nr:hypoxanthine phosphoribosyltransferase [Lentisphaeria bacterium]